MSWFRAAALARDYAAIARRDIRPGMSRAERQRCQDRAQVLADFADVLQANGNDDRTDPRIMIVPPEAIR